ncbi:MAG: type III-B CRISPR module-associated protein Cmr5 [Desulfococcaceae bacterium]|jgi:CRISPR type III-B/RAMP module-associated protein Cmr5|nr:type III-B CRISPR module-associated protein Cmr5 [Desulfococcaceae bacterium]
MSKNMDQKRASFALELVAPINDKTKADELKTHSAKLIALIQNSGFLQAMDFAESKMDTLHRHIQSWFAKEPPDGPGLSENMRNAAAADNRLNSFLAEMTDRNEYRRAMQEAVAFLGWLKSKAEGKRNELKAQQNQAAEGEG